MIEKYFMGPSVDIAFEDASLHSVWFGGFGRRLSDEVWGTVKIPCTPSPNSDCSGQLSLPAVVRPPGRCLLVTDEFWLMIGFKPLVDYAYRPGNAWRRFYFAKAGPYVPFEMVVPCSRCRGTGKMTRLTTYGNPYRAKYDTITEKCSSCDGSGTKLHALTHRERRRGLRAGKDSVVYGGPIPKR